jgi:DNA-binding beta-propeller fold protein YncE
MWTSLSSSARARAIPRLCIFVTLAAACSRGAPPVPLSATVTLPAASGPFVEFESGPVRPLALSRDGHRLYVANIPDGRVEIFTVADQHLRHEGSVAVGLEPVALALRNEHELWVVNHLSDSISIVEVGCAAPHVVRTLLVGDEPRDIVFAGRANDDTNHDTNHDTDHDNGQRAFVTTAHRGQRRSDPALAGVPGAGDPALTTPGIGRADVWVFDAAHLGDDAGGRPLAILSLFGDTPRALATSPDGTTVYAAVFKSGNQTTTVSQGVVCPGFDSGTPCIINGVTYPGGVAGPATNHAGAPAPEVGIIVKFDPTSGHWRDGIGRVWDNAVRFSLPDQDVFAVDAASLKQTAAWAHVGTTLFNLIANPHTGALYVSNLESRNDTRFEGPGIFGHSTVQGHLAEARISVINGASVSPRHLNKHIDYSVRPAPPGIADASLATPLEMALSRDGATLYVAAFGSGKVGVLSSAALEDDALDPVRDSTRYISVSGGGPGGLALDDAHGKLCVYTRFDDGVSLVDVRRGVELHHVLMHNPEPPAVVHGRRFLYDARLTSSNGEAACASCHIFGDNDDLAWDLGNPDGDVTKNPIPIILGALTQGFFPPLNGSGNNDDFHPQKGPMTTQTLRGMVNHGAMHWRGDRSNGFFGVDTRTAPPFDSDLAFRNFIVAFPGLLGRADQISPDDMAKFSAFALALTMPPNPQRALDNSLTPAQARGRAFYLGCDGVDSFTGAPPAADCVTHPPTDGHGHLADGVPFGDGNGKTCQQCHTLDPGRGFFGTSGFASFEALPQIFKIPQLRNLYTKVGMFGNPVIDFFGGGSNDFMGDQVRGFGFLNDGSVDTVFHFVQARVFDANLPRGLKGFAGADPDGQRRDVEQFLLAFDSDVAPVVGQQVTLTARNGASAGPRIDLLRARAAQPFASQILGVTASECDLVAAATVQGVAMQWLYQPLDGSFQPDDGGQLISDAALRALAGGGKGGDGSEVTYTCVPPGSGVRVALDRDGDGVFNRRDRCPADAGCF